MNEKSDYLVHYGVPGLKWGVRKRSYTREPAGYSIKLQGEVANAERAYRNANGFSNKRKAKRNYKQALKKKDAAIKEYRQFERDSYKKVGNAFKYKQGSDGNWYNRHGKKVSDLDMKGAREFQLRKMGESERWKNKFTKQYEKQQNKIGKTNKYRDKLVNRSNKYEQMNINSARKENAKYKDLKRYGRKSGTWQDHLADQWENDTFGNERLERYSPRTQQSLKRLDITIKDRLTTDAEFNKYMRDITIERDASSRRARQWAQTSKDLENMTIDELTTKRDVRKVFRNGH